MSLPNEVNLQHLGSTGYNITKSLRFRESASANLTRTFASAGNRRTYTISMWVKRGTLGGSNVFSLYAAGVPNGSPYNYGRLSFYQDNILFDEIVANSINSRLITTAVYRDPSAWYHVVLAVDTTQATSSNRYKLYVNGSQVTAFTTATYPAQNFEGSLSDSTKQAIGSYNDSSSNLFDGYIADAYFIDGTQKAATDFGETDSITGVWKPKAYSGTYGTNGFYLKFADVTSTSTLGNDSSGNGNTWTTSNVSVTAGSTYDSMTDVPTMSATASNYCTLNPISTQGAGAVIYNGNLYTNAASWKTAGGTQALSSGKWYYELTVAAFSSSAMYGVFNSNFNSWSTYMGASAYGWAWQYTGAGSGPWNNNTPGSPGVSGTGGSTNGALNDVYMCAFDVDAGKIWWGKNGTWFSGDPAAGTSPGYSGLTGTLTPGVSSSSTGDVCSLNFGQKAFSYTAPSGFKAINTYNLPEPTIKAGNKYMDATLYTGDGTTGRTITNDGSFQPDFVWIKSRSNALNNNVYDSNRGAPLELSTNLTSADSSGDLTAFNTTGFTINQTAGYEINHSGYTYVGWQWQAGQNANTTNTSGSITSQVNANPTAGFSIVTWTGTGAAGTIGHGLGVTPSMVIVKNRTTAATNWTVWFTGYASTEYLLLNLTDAKQTNGSTLIWSGTPTSSIVQLGTSSQTNGSGNGLVAYCWTPIPGFSQFGSYTGNGSADGPFVYLGFRPKFILVKQTNTSGQGWVLYDSSRNLYNLTNASLAANSSGAEVSPDSTNNYDLLSNGFKARNSGLATNTSGGTYIYAAWAENPFKYSLAR